MNYSVKAIVKDVRKILDENEVSIALINDSDNDTLTLDTIITHKIVDAALAILKIAPNKYLDSGVNLPTDIMWEKSRGNGMGSIDLPDDFLRLLIFQMSDWRRPVLDVIYGDDPLYFLQKSKFAGIRGGIDKPVCAITNGIAGRVMEFYSCLEGESVTIKKAKYIATPKIVDDTIDICTNLYIPTLYHTASLVALTYKDSEHSTRINEVALTYIQ